MPRQQHHEPFRLMLFFRLKHFDYVANETKKFEPWRLLCLQKNAIGFEPHGLMNYQAHRNIFEPCRLLC